MGFGVLVDAFGLGLGGYLLGVLFGFFLDISFWRGVGVI